MKISGQIEYENLVEAENLIDELLMCLQFRINCNISTTTVKELEDLSKDFYSRREKYQKELLKSINKK